MRAFLAGLLVAVGLLLLPLAVLGVWTQLHVISTDGFLDLSTDVLAEDDIRQALAVRLADELEARDSRLSAGRAVLVPAVREVTGTSAFEAVFRTAAGGVHAQLEQGDDTLALDLDPALPLIRQQVAQVDAGLAERVPDSADLPAITVLERDDAPEVWDAVELTRKVSLAFPLLAAAALIAAVVLARRRAVMLVVVGVGAVVVAILVIAALRLAQDPLSNAAGSQVDVAAFDAGYDVITGSIGRFTIVLGVLGALTGAAGVASMIWYQRSIRPTGWA